MDRQSFAELFIGMQSLVRPLLINVMVNDSDTHLINQLPVFGGQPCWQRISSLTPENSQQAFLTLVFPEWRFHWKLWHSVLAWWCCCYLRGRAHQLIYPKASLSGQCRGR